MKDWVLVTGGLGYVGSHCVVKILEAGHNVAVMDNLSNAGKEVMDKIEKLSGKSVPLHDADLRDKIVVKKVFDTYSNSENRITCVIHFAGLKAVGESVAQPLRYYQNNVTGSINLLQVMEEAGVKRLVFSSSATVYGQPVYLPIDEEHPIGDCTNPYGKTKFFVEEIFKDVCVASPDWSVTLLRYFNPAGAHPSGEIGEDPQGIPNNLFPFVAQVAVGVREELNIFGDDFDTKDGTGCRDYVHVEDLAAGHVSAVQQLVTRVTCPGVRVYNLGTGRGYTVMEVVAAFEAVIGRKLRTRVTARRPGDVDTCFAVTDKAREELGFQATKTLAEMCHDEYKWRMKNTEAKKA